MLKRFLVTISLTLAMLGNIVAGVQCTSSGIDSNLADCCKDGMCPHHLSGEETQSCPHTLSPDATLSLTILNALPATVEKLERSVIQFKQVGLADRTVELPRIYIQPVLFTFHASS